MKFRKLATKMYVFILPVIIVAMVLLTVVSVTSSSSMMDSQIEQTMQASLGKANEDISNDLDAISNMATTIAKFVESTYQHTDMDDFLLVLSNIIQTNSNVLGSGLWFEPYVFDKTQKYMGPYVYKDGSNIVYDWEYSNEEYDYFNQEYYTQTMNTTVAQFTDPYYDPASGIVMSSCSIPLLDDGKFIGCVTVDIELTSITSIVREVKVGQTGSAIFLSSVGTILAGAYEDKIASEAIAINQTENESLNTAGEQILANPSGEGSYVADDGNKYDIYWETNPSTGWKLILQIADLEIAGPLKKLAMQLIIICAVALLITIAVVFFIVMSITKSIKKVQSFAGTLASGDFTVDCLSVASKDEIGSMSGSLNDMYESNKSVISNIKDRSVEINESAVKLESASRLLDEKFRDIQSFMNTVNSDMLTTSAATEELNASAEEVLSNTNILVTETDASKKLSDEIHTRAVEVGENSQEAYRSAVSLANDFQERLRVSMENAKVVDNIGILAASISNIAEQINLLSLNASIEAARAGESGRGFAVVATEIGKLAGSTSESVNQIQGTIAEVQTAFSTLTKDSQSLLSFLTDTVSPDYQKFVDVADQYGKDAESIRETSDKISSIADTIKYVMQEVSDAVMSIAEATQSTTELSGNILRNIESATTNVEEMSQMSEQQEEIAGNLNDVVSKFTL